MNIDEMVERYLNESVVPKIGQTIKIIKDDDMKNKLSKWFWQEKQEWDFRKGDELYIKSRVKHANVSIVDMVSLTKNRKEMMEFEKTDGAGIKDSYLNMLIKKGIATLV